MILKNTLFWQNFEIEPVADREWGEIGNFLLISHFIRENCTPPPNRINFLPYDSHDLVDRTLSAHPPLTHKTQANLT